jgi:hypothetical protein
MIRQSVQRFAEKDHAAQKSMIRQSVQRFAEKDHAAQNPTEQDRFDLK